MPAPNTVDPNTSRVRLDLFSGAKGLDRGRSKSVEAAWYLIKCAFFLSALPWPSRLRCVLLRMFGAKIGVGVNVKPRVNIHFPWKLTIGDHAWIGEEVFILNFEPVEIGSQACLSQRAFLCGGNHDFRAIDFAFRNGPIQVGHGAWVGAQVFVAPHVRIGDYAVVTAGSVVLQDQPAGLICSGNPCQPQRARFRDDAAHG